MQNDKSKIKSNVNDKTATIHQLRNLCLKFRAERAWTDEKAATFVKDIAVEAGELLAHFVWEEEVYKNDPEIAKEVKYELADVLYGVFILSHILKIDLAATLKEKINVLAEKYPSDECRKKIMQNDETAWRKWASQRKKQWHTSLSKAQRH